VTEQELAAVRDAFDALVRGGPEAMLEFVHEDFHGVVPPELSAEPDTYDGHEGIRRYFRLFDETVQNLTWTLEDLIDDGDRALGHFVMAGTGRESGVPVEMRVVGAVRVRDGKLIEMTAYRDLAEARAGR
jgi:ketosteroid isomerase-like protein